MKKRLQGLIAGILIGVMSVGGIAGAKEMNENVEVFYNNIKIFIDGAEIVPKDAAGNTVEPFIMNGTTYLPVRAIANAFGKDVEWDGATAGVYIGKKDETKPDNYLHKIQYNDYKTVRGNLNIINGSIIDFNKETYTNGLLLNVLRDDVAFRIKDDPDDASILVSYPLNSQYDNLKGRIVIPKEVHITTLEYTDGEAIDIEFFIYGDDELLFNNTATASMPLSLDIDIKGVNSLTIKAKSHSDSRTVNVALTDLALYK